MKGEINAAANFQSEDFVSKNKDFDCLANPISASNAKLENSVKAKDKKNEAPFSSRRGSSHVLELFSKSLFIIFSEAKQRKQERPFAG